MSAGHKLAHHDFAVHQIFGTSQADKTDFQEVIQALRSAQGANPRRHKSLELTKDWRQEARSVLRVFLKSIGETPS